MTQSAEAENTPTAYLQKGKAHPKSALNMTLNNLKNGEASVMLEV